MARDYLYHVWDHPDFDGKPALSSIELKVPKNIEDTKDREPKRFYSLRRDLAHLRAEGKKKNIVDDSFTALPDKSLAGRELWAIKIGRGDKHKVLLCGAHHSREWISVELCYYIAEYLVTRFSESPKSEEDKRIKHLLTNRQVFVVPLVNPDGHQFTVETDRFWRANRRELTFAQDTEINVEQTKKRTIKVKAGKYYGIDVNRNYAVSDWGHETYYKDFPTYRGTSRDPAEGGRNSIFCGLSAGSEPETQAIQNLVNKEQFGAAISFHSFGQDWIFHDGARNNSYLKELKDGMDQLVRQYGNPYNFRFSDEYKYSTTGDFIDFHVEKRPGHMATTPELRPKSQAPLEQSFSGLPESEIQPCVNENLAAVLALMNAAAFSDEPAQVKAKASAAAPVVQVVRGAWRPFDGWKSTLP